MRVATNTMNNEVPRDCETDSLYGGRGAVVWWLALWTSDRKVVGHRSSLASLCCRVVSLYKKLYLTLPLFTQVYKWVLAIIMLGGGGGPNLAMNRASHPGGSSDIPCRFMLYGNRN